MSATMLESLLLEGGPNILLGHLLERLFNGGRLNLAASVGFCTARCGCRSNAWPHCCTHSLLPEPYRGKVRYPDVSVL